MLLLEDKLKEIAEDIETILPEYFGINVDDRDGTFEDIEIAYDLYDIGYKYYGLHCEYECGVSKAVLAPSGCNYVIKIPFNCHIYEEYPYDEESECYDYDCEPDISYDDFTNAPGDNCSDYCAAEVYIYNLAKDWGLDFLFAETKRITPRVYIQEKIAVEDNSASSDVASSRPPSEKARSTAQKWIEEDSCPLECYWLSSLIEWYGEDVAKRLLDFISTYDIHDFHSGNVGWRLTGEPVISDYSSWED